MKKVLFIALLCAIAITTKAQVNSIGIQNNSGCDIWVVLYGSTGACATTHQSAPILVTAGGTLGYSDPTTVPGGMNGGGTSLGPTDVFTRAQVLHGNPNHLGLAACISPGGVSVTGSGCAGPSSASINVITSFPVGTGWHCIGCATVNVVWNPAGISAAVVQIF